MKQNSCVRGRLFANLSAKMFQQRQFVPRRTKRGETNRVRLRVSLIIQERRIRRPESQHEQRLANNQHEHRPRPPTPDSPQTGQLREASAGTSDCGTADPIGPIFQPASESVVSLSPLKVPCQQSQYRITDSSHGNGERADSIAIRGEHPDDDSEHADQHQRKAGAIEPPSSVRVERWFGHADRLPLRCPRHPARRQMIHDVIHLLVGQFRIHRQAQAFIGPRFGFAQRTAVRPQMAIRLQSMQRERIVDAGADAVLFEGLQFLRPIGDSDHIEMPGIVASGGLGRRQNDVSAPRQPLVVTGGMRMAQGIPCRSDARASLPARRLARCRGGY